MTQLQDVVAYLNKRFNQDSDEYSIFFGAKPQVIRYNDETAISIWSCGAIVVIGSTLYFVNEDDGYWFVNEYIDIDDIDRDTENQHKFSHSGMQTPFSIGWLDSFMNAMRELQKYVEENGGPVYYVDTDNVCHYELKTKE